MHCWICIEKMCFKAQMIFKILGPDIQLVQTFFSENIDIKNSFAVLLLFYFSTVLMSNNSKMAFSVHFPPTRRVSSQRQESLNTSRAFLDASVCTIKSSGTQWRLCHVSGGFMELYLVILQVLFLSMLLLCTQLFSLYLFG